jgi:hypothetical protein
MLVRPAVPELPGNEERIEMLGWRTTALALLIPVGPSDTARAPTKP